ncbi:MAG: arginase family protein [Parafilimonas sp.]
MKQLTIIQAPSNLGLKEPASGVEPGVKFLPGALLDKDFAKKLNVFDVSQIQSCSYSMHIDEETKVRNADNIVCYSENLANCVYEAIKKNKFPLVLGGDCSILLGTMLGLRKAGNYGLFFLDGHTDYMFPEQSGTAGAAGMDLAFVTGNGHKKLSDIQGLSPYVKEENIFCVGNREYTNWYVDLIKQSNIHYYDLAAIRKTGIKKIIDDFLLMIKNKKLDGFWIHLDVDVLNDEIMPCVDSRAEDGVSYSELHEILIPLLSSELVSGIEITILDPTLDKENKYVSEFCNQMVEIFLYTASF